MSDHNHGPEVIRAAGGIVFRDTPRGREFAIIHRKRHSDWTLPKGKLEPGEDWQQAALREVREETGCQVEIIEFIGESQYAVKNVPKTVRYWAMRSDGECRFRPNEEVDRLEWLPLDAAIKRLEYPSEQSLLKKMGAHE